MTCKNGRLGMKRARDSVFRLIKDRTENDINNQIVVQVFLVKDN